MPRPPRPKLQGVLRPAAEAMLIDDVIGDLTKSQLGERMFEKPNGNINWPMLVHTSCKYVSAPIPVVPRPCRLT